MKKILGENRFFVLLTLLYFMRAFYLDADACSYALTQIQPIDEMYYNEIAYNIGSSGLATFLIDGPGKISIPNAKTYLIPNIVNGICLLLFGKNFIALRISTVFWGYFAMVLLYMFMKYICGSQKKHACLFIGMFYLFDFNNLALSRSAIPIVPCMFAETMFVYFVLRSEKRSNRLGLILGAIPVILFCCVYMGLPFLLLASIVIVIGYCWNNRNEKEVVKTILCYYLAGVFCGVIVSDILMRIFLKEDVFHVIMAVFSGFSNKIKGSILFDVITYMHQSRQFIMSNMFRYDPILLFAFCGSIFYAIYLCVHERKMDFKLFVLVVVILCHWLMTVIVENATLSKATISYGTILMLIGYVMSIAYQKHIGKFIEQAVSLIFICASWLWTRSYQLEINAFSHKTLRTITVCGICMLVFLILWMQSKRHKRIFGLIAIVISFGIETGLSLHYIFLNKTYNDVSICKNVGDIAGNNAVIGGFPLGFALYNDIRPVFGTYDRYREYGFDPEYVLKAYPDITERYEVLFFLDYDKKDRLEEVNRCLEGTPYIFEIVARYERTYYGDLEGDSDIMLCKKIRR